MQPRAVWNVTLVDLALKMLRVRKNLFHICWRHVKGLGLLLSHTGFPALGSVQFHVQWWPWGEQLGAGEEEAVLLQSSSWAECIPVLHPGAVGPFTCFPLRKMPSAWIDTGYRLAAAQNQSNRPLDADGCKVSSLRITVIQLGLGWQGHTATCFPEVKVNQNVFLRTVWPQNDSSHAQWPTDSYRKGQALV